MLLHPFSLRRGNAKKAIGVPLFKAWMETSLHVRWQGLWHKFRKLHWTDFSKCHAFPGIHTAYQKIRIFKKQIDAAANIIKYLPVPENPLYCIERKIFAQSRNIVLQALTHFAVSTICAFKCGPNRGQFIPVFFFQRFRRSIAQKLQQGFHRLIAFMHRNKNKNDIGYQRQRNNANKNYGDMLHVAEHKLFIS